MDIDFLGGAGQPGVVGIDGIAEQSFHRPNDQVKVRGLVQVPHNFYIQVGWSGLRASLCGLEYQKYKQELWSEERLGNET